MPANFPGGSALQLRKGFPLRSVVKDFQPTALLSGQLPETTFSVSAFSYHYDLIIYYYNQPYKKVNKKITVRRSPSLSLYLHGNEKTLLHSPQSTWDNSFPSHRNGG